MSSTPGVGSTRVLRLSRWARGFRGIAPGTAVAVAVGAALITLALAPTAEAAAATVTLVTASPGVGAALSSAPGAVTLTFDQNLVKGRLTVTGPDGKARGAGGFVIDGASLNLPLASGLPAGTYTVTWVAKAKGSPRSHGSYSFRVTGVSVATPPPVTTRPPASGAGSGTTQARPSPPAARKGSSPGAAIPVAPVPTRVGATATRDVAAAGSGSVSTGTTAPSAAPTTGVPAVGTALTARGESGAKRTVGAVVSGSRFVGLWLIGIAVLLQLGAGLWGLWRWRRAGDTEGAGSASAVARSIDQPDEEGARVRALVTSPAWPDRAWTGELPVRRQETGGG